MSEVKKVGAGDGRNLTAEKDAPAWSVTAEVRAEVLGRVAEAAEAGKAAEKASDVARYRQAIATYAVVSVGGIGEGRIFETQDAYAAVAGIKSKSSVTALKYLGRLIADMDGLTPAHKD
jgi:hypothetical protein